MPAVSIARPACLAAIVWIGAVPFAAVGEIAGSGNVVYTLTPLSSDALPGGSLINQAILKGIVLADDPNHPLHLTAQDCSGGSIADDQGKMMEGAGSCTMVDRDGDVWWLWYHNRGDDRQWGAIAGTGKYDGVTGSGVTAELAATADGRLAISWQGTLTLK